MSVATPRNSTDSPLGSAPPRAMKANAAVEAVPADPFAALSRQLFRHRLLVFAAIHFVLFVLAMALSFGLAYNFHWNVGSGGEGREGVIAIALKLAWLAVPIKMLVFFLAGQFHRSWRYVGLHDLLGVVRASLISAFLYVVLYFALENAWLQGYGRRLIDGGILPSLRQSVFLLDFGATVVLVCAARVVVRFYYEELRANRGSEPLCRVLVVGAGDEAESVIRDLHRTAPQGYQVIGLIGETPVNHETGRIHGVPLLGSLDCIHEICEMEKIQEVLVALPRLSPRQMRRLVESCQGLGIRFRMIPSVYDLVSGNVTISQLRDVEIEDLLRRSPVRLDRGKIGEQITGKCIAVTGAGGSIGAELCRQIAAFKPRALVLMEQAENPLFSIERELRAAHRDLSIRAHIVDVTDRPRASRLIKEEKPDWLFHAAAHKHVPLMEQCPGEAIKNNVGGTRMVADACLDAGVPKMVLISTDKAVNPTSVMGCSKRIAEKYVQSLKGRGATHFITVRFGNVLGSEGSVVPIFKAQIAAGGPVTVTHADMRRYFMTIPEAVQLVLQAGSMGRGGELYMLDMGEPVRILDLARDLITLSGLKPQEDIEIVFTGLRPGEKLFEELRIDGEQVCETGHPQIGVFRSLEEDPDAITSAIDELGELADRAESARLREAMQRIVPEYAPAPC